MAPSPSCLSPAAPYSGPSWLTWQSRWTRSWEATPTSTACPSRHSEWTSRATVRPVSHPGTQDEGTGAVTARGRRARVLFRQPRLCLHCLKREPHTSDPVAEPARAGCEHALRPSHLAAADQVTCCHQGQVRAAGGRRGWRRSLQSPGSCLRTCSGVPEATPGMGTKLVPRQRLRGAARGSCLSSLSLGRVHDSDAQAATDPGSALTSTLSWSGSPRGRGSPKSTKMGCHGPLQKIL